MDILYKWFLLWYRFLSLCLDLTPTTNIPQNHVNTKKPNSSQTLPGKISVSNVKRNCKASDFRCHNRNCIPAQHMCNGVNDCEDNSDESRCQGTLKLQLRIWIRQYRSLPCNISNRYLPLKWFDEINVG